MRYPFEAGQVLAGGASYLTFAALVAALGRRQVAAWPVESANRRCPAASQRIWL